MHFRAVALLAACLTLAACGGGGGGSATAPPVAGPTASPTSTPAPAPMSASTQSLNLISTTNPAPFTVSEPNYTGTFSVSGCKGVATVNPGSASGPSATFNAIAATPGTCTLTISDQLGQSVTMSVTATTTSGTIQ